MDKKWNLQDIRPAGEQRRKRAAGRTQQTEASTAAEEQPKQAPATRTRTPRNNAKKRKPLVIGLLVLLLVLIPGIVIGFLLDGAEITVHPRVREPNVNGAFEAYREPQAGQLAYEVMTLEAEGERQVTATGEEQVSEQATGEIVIENTRSTSERLIKNTRFESPSGLVYRITESVVVPAGSEENPGTVRAAVFADQPGEEYNIDPTTFVIPGYREGGYSELFASVTARSTAPMSGGYNGPRYVIDDTELATARESLHQELQDALRERVGEERPAGFVLFEPAITFAYESLPATEAGGDQVTIHERVALNVPIFSAPEFASHIAAATIPGYENQPVRIDNPEVLTFAYTATSTASADIRDVDQLQFRLSGTPRVVWAYDEGALAADLAGAAKTALPSVLSGYPAIERAEAVIRPFWKRSFPEDPESITVTEAFGSTGGAE